MCAPQHFYDWIYVIVLALVEFYLGRAAKSGKSQVGSSIECILLLLTMIITFFKKGKHDGN